MLAHLALAETSADPISPLENRHFGAMLEQHVCTTQASYASAYDTNVRYLPCCYPEHRCRVSVLGRQIELYAVGRRIRARADCIWTIARFVSPVLVAYIAHGFECDQSITWKGAGKDIRCDKSDCV